MSGKGHTYYQLRHIRTDFVAMFDDQPTCHRLKPIRDCAPNRIGMHSLDLNWSKSTFPLENKTFQKRGQIPGK